MNRNTFHDRGSQLRLMASATLVTMLIAGCASQAALDDDAASQKGSRATAGELYEGEPAVMHATEYPVASAAEGIARGDAAWRKGDLDLAVYLYVQSLAYDASNSEPLLRIGAIHERRGNKALAEKAFEMALKIDPDNPAINERLGLLYLQGGRSAAVPLLEHALGEDPRRWQSHNGLGIAADRNKDFAAAISHYDAALALEPRATITVNNRGYSRYLAGDFAGAEDDFRRALQMSPLTGTWTNLGRAAGTAGQLRGCAGEPSQGTRCAERLQPARRSRHGEWRLHRSAELLLAGHQRVAKILQGGARQPGEREHATG